MNPKILRGLEVDEFLTQERCWITESWNSEEDPALSIARVFVEPGVTTQWHSLDGIHERYLIIKGTAQVEVGDLSPVDVGVGDVVVIPAGVRQRIKNTGCDELIFYALCTPRYQEHCYQNLEEL
ncbi:MAG: cupin domain-containing protein [Gammaproteobacteria bacterium]|nr:cupin domain-containing protein [Gammaproteobacteria bacterium]